MIFLLNSGPVFRWSEGRNTILLREVLTSEPFLYKVGSKEAGQKWSETADKVNSYSLFKSTPRDQRSVREQFNKLIGEYKKKKQQSQKASGVEEDPPTEIDSLLEDITEKMSSEPIRVDNANSKKLEKKRKEALACREKAMTTWVKAGKSTDMDSDSDEETVAAKRPRRSRKKSSDAFAFLSEKSEREAELRKEEMELKRKELELQTQQLQQMMQSQQNTQNLVLALIQKMSK